MRNQSNQEHGSAQSEWAPAMWKTSSIPNYGCSGAVWCDAIYRAPTASMFKGDQIGLNNSSVIAANPISLAHRRAA
jgi:hypothetical protein